MQLAEVREKLRVAEVQGIKTRSELRAALQAVNVLVDEVRCPHSARHHDNVYSAPCALKHSAL